MFSKKKIDQTEIHGVKMINGTVSLAGVALNVYSFVVDGVLIDTGPQSLAKYFQPILLEQDVDQVIITHHHEDHTGNAGFVQQRRQLPVYMHPKYIADCTQKADYPLYRKIFWGSRPPFQAKPISDSFASRTAQWKVIETPGHADDHIAFLNTETGQLFSGDLYVYDKVKVVLRNENLPLLIQSIQKVLTYDFSEMYCSHAGYIQDGRAALQRKLDHLLEMQYKILRLHQEGYTIEQIHKIIYPKKYPITFFSSGEWDSIHVIRSFIQHSNPLP